MIGPITVLISVVVVGFTDNFDLGLGLESVWPTLERNICSFADGAMFLSSSHNVSSVCWSTFQLRVNLKSKHTSHSRFTSR